MIVPICIYNTCIYSKYMAKFGAFVYWPYSSIKYLNYIYILLLQNKKIDLTSVPWFHGWGHSKHRWSLGERLSRTSRHISTHRSARLVTESKLGSCEYFGTYVCKYAALFVNKWYFLLLCYSLKLQKGIWNLILNRLNITNTI